MYIRRIVYDNSCEFSTDKCRDAMQQNALFDLTKDYIYVVNDKVTSNCINSGSSAKNDEIKV